MLVGKKNVWKEAWSAFVPQTKVRLWRKRLVLMGFVLQKEKDLNESRRNKSMLRMVFGKGWNIQRIVTCVCVYLLDVCKTASPLLRTRYLGDSNEKGQEIPIIWPAWWCWTGNSDQAEWKCQTALSQFDLAEADWSDVWEVGGRDKRKIRQEINDGHWVRPGGLSGTHSADLWSYSRASLSLSVLTQLIHLRSFPAGRSPGGSGTVCKGHRVRTHKQWPCLFSSSLTVQVYNYRDVFSGSVLVTGWTGSVLRLWFRARISDRFGLPVLCLWAKTKWLLFIQQGTKSFAQKSEFHTSICRCVEHLSDQECATGVL